MWPTVLILLLCSFLLSLALASVYHDYCIVGGGPSGLQLGYFMKTASRDYIVFERSNISGSFFQQYPRHRKLISLNKRNTGKVNKEFNLRHDWNSLLSHDPDLLVTKYSREIFPNADVLVKYLDDYQKKLDINVKFNANIYNIRTEKNQSSPDGQVFTMQDQTGQSYVCRTLIMATGVSTPNIPNGDGINLTVGYESMSLNPEDYEGKSVLILGRGNSAFEIADSIYGYANFIHLLGRSRIRLAWATHYVGDLRAVNNAVLDTYQLKSLDGLFEMHVDTEMKLIQKGGKIYLPEVDDELITAPFERTILEPYDVVIRALGFIFDTSPFYNKSLTLGAGKLKKYPAITHNYESVDYTGLFYAGTASHSLDFRKSSGGFIHGFRYTARALHRLMEWRYEGIPWPYIDLRLPQLMNYVIKRMNEVSGTYQMFQVLGDVLIVSEDKESIRVIEEFPIHLLHELPQRTGHNGSAYIVIVLEYGHNFSGPNNDVFRLDRAVGGAIYASLSNFLHPVIYYYSQLPTEESMQSKSKNETLPRPDYIHHIVEDFYTSWQKSQTHILPLRRFFEKVLSVDLRTFYTKSCFLVSMTKDKTSQHCKQSYLLNQGLYGTKELKLSSMYRGLILTI
ncbi:FAD-dependent oxidoreductase domain-containing protein 2 [Biomphalaria glabrata]|uniref:FAD-dependent oxidoreductase domain-containing protein 2 n=1 Tax=Biomphalaria glabrata TaxID=6526 RepID=A0A2C9K1U2_BIOGL|nr:FAD-dependent oxidoreductase domain-containing protein 2 [Biomphalaria glabrata]